MFGRKKHRRGASQTSTGNSQVASSQVVSTLSDPNESSQSEIPVISLSADVDAPVSNPQTSSSSSTQMPPIRYNSDVRQADTNTNQHSSTTKHHRQPSYSQRDDDQTSLDALSASDSTLSPVLPHQMTSQKNTSEGKLPSTHSANQHQVDQNQQNSGTDSYPSSHISQPVAQNPSSQGQDSRVLRQQQPQSSTPLYAQGGLPPTHSQDPSSPLHLQAQSFPFSQAHPPPPPPPRRRPPSSTIHQTQPPSSYSQVHTTNQPAPLPQQPLQPAFLSPCTNPVRPSRVPPGYPVQPPPSSHHFDQQAHNRVNYGPFTDSYHPWMAQRMPTISSQSPQPVAEIRHEHQPQTNQPLNSQDCSPASIEAELGEPEPESNLRNNEPNDSDDLEKRGSVPDTGNTTPPQSEHNGQRPSPATPLQLTMTMSTPSTPQSAPLTDVPPPQSLPPLPQSLPELPPRKSSKSQSQYQNQMRPQQPPSQSPQQTTPWSPTASSNQARPSSSTVSKMAARFGNQSWDSGGNIVVKAQNCAPSNHGGHPATPKVNPESSESRPPPPSSQSGLNGAILQSDLDSVSNAPFTNNQSEHRPTEEYQNGALPDRRDSSLNSAIPVAADAGATSNPNAANPQGSEPITVPAQHESNDNISQNGAEGSGMSPPTDPEPVMLRVMVVGGGPSALIFATSLKTLLGPKVSLEVLESRVVRDPTLPPPSLRWKTRSERVNRREQVVTLQSAVYSSLPRLVQHAIFPPQGYSNVWPVGGESPEHLGFPRNIRILDIEDRLLQLASAIGITVRPERAYPKTVDATIQSGSADFIVVADGPASRTREAYIEAFGKTDPRPFALPSAPDTPIEDTVLALRVRCHMRDPDTVVLTVSQNRFLLNARDGDGYLYMRLTKYEAAEVRGRTPTGKYFTGCIQSEPCNMILDEDDEDGRDGQSFACPTHGTMFIPAMDPHSLLWPRVREGLRLYNCEVTAVTVFRLSMTLRPRYSAELTKLGTVPPVFGALIGDAANAIHFWPGRGLNHGIYSAVALARTLHTAVMTRRRVNFVRSAELTRFEAAMHALQHRHKDRAWRAMVQPRGGDGPKDSNEVITVSDVIAETIEQSDGLNNRNEMLAEMDRRLTRISNSLARRLPTRPVAKEILERLRKHCSIETLNVLVRSGTWETYLSGGPEVDINALTPLYGAMNDSKKVSNAAQQSDSDLVNANLYAPNNSCDIKPGTDILSEESIRWTFQHACRFAGADTLAWTEASREIQALLLRAGKNADVSVNDVFDAIEEADEDESDRIDCDEFLSAVQRVLATKQRKIQRLGEVWREKFLNAADASQFVTCRNAAGIVSRLARNMRPARPDLTDRSVLRSEFERRCDSGSDLICLNKFLEVAALVMFGE